ncbi:MAG: hypothetical protein ACE5J3_03010 [Methanosarcinales archaeon]
MQEKQILKIFEDHKYLTLEKFITISSISEKKAKAFLRALFNKATLDKIKVDGIEYFFLPDLIKEEDIKKELAPKEEAPKKKKASWKFFDKLMDLLNKEVEVVYNDGYERHTIKAVFRAYEQYHLSLLLDTEDGVMFLRGNAVVSIKELK